MNKKVRIAFIGGKTYPIPDVKGGAMQALVTAILRQNESHQDFLIDVYTGYDSLLKKEQSNYKLTRIIPIRCSHITMVYDMLWCAMSKLTMHNIPTKSYFMSRVNHYIRKKHYDFIIVESSDKEVRELKNTGDGKIWYHVHSDYLDHNNARMRQALEKCDKLVGVSDYITYRIGGQKFAHKAETLANAIEVSTYVREMSTEKRVALRQRLGCDSGDKVVIYCSRLSPEKGCLELIDAVAMLPQCRLIVIGGENFSSDRETEYTKRLNSAAEKACGRIVFTGYVSHKDIFEYLSIADIGVVPSVCNEAASLTLLEMRASGLATIASNRGGIPEYASVQGTVLVETDESFVENLASAITKLCSDDLLMESMKRQSRVDLDQFDYSSYYHRFLSLIRKDIVQSGGNLADENSYEE